MNRITHSTKVRILIESFLVLLALMRLFQIHTVDFISLILFSVSYFILNAIHQLSISHHTEKHDHISCILLGSFFSICTCLASYTKILNGLSNTLFCFLIISGTLLGLFLIYYYFIQSLLYLSESYTFQSHLYSITYLPAATFGGCLLAWLPSFLYHYPGTMTPDSINQYAQIIGVYAQSNHHPWVHTQLIHLFYSIGMKLTGSPIHALAFYTVFQIICMAFVAAYTVQTLQKAHFATPFCVITSLFYALMPYQSALVTTIWKDVLFAGAVTLFTCTLFRLFLYGREREEQKGVIFVLVLYGISGIMVCLFRTNGWYAFLLSLPFIIYTFRSRLKWILPANAAILIICLLIKIPIMNIYEVTQPDFAESLSIPAQQIASVFANGHQVTDEQLSQLELIIDTSKLAESYQPNVYDPVKYLLRDGDQTYLTNHKGEYLSLWFSIGLSHPKDYLDAFIQQTIGFWYPDVSYQVGLDEGIYVNDFGLAWSPVIRGSLPIKIKEIIFKLWDMVPLYGLLWSMGAIFWSLLICVALCIKKKQQKFILLYLPALAMVLTLCLATPVAAEFRYAYALFYTFPLYLAAPFTNDKRTG